MCVCVCACARDHATFFTWKNKRRKDTLYLCHQNNIKTRAIPKEILNSKTNLKLIYLKFFFFFCVEKTKHNTLLCNTLPRWMSGLMLHDTYALPVHLAVGLAQKTSLLWEIVILDLYNFDKTLVRENCLINF